MTRTLSTNSTAGRVCLFTLLLAFGACAKRTTPVPVQPTPPPQTQAPVTRTAPPPPPAQPIDEALPVPEQPLTETSLDNRSLDDLNRDSPLRPAFFPLDAADLDAQGRRVVDQNAEVLKQHPSWIITIEGHCDERGTAEYNLALGERRAVGVKTYLVSLGIAPDRIRTVTYGKEFPFDPAHTEQAWESNRRAHFVITAK